MKGKPMDWVPVMFFSSYPKALAAGRRLEGAGISPQIDAPPALCMNLWHGQGDSGIALRVQTADLSAARACLGRKLEEKAAPPARSRRETGTANRSGTPAGGPLSLFRFLRMLDQI